MLPNIDFIGLMLHVLPVHFYILLLSAITIDFRYSKKTTVLILSIWYILSAIWSFCGYLFFAEPLTGIGVPISNASASIPILLSAIVICLVSKDNFYQTLFNYFTLIILYFGYMFLSFTICMMWFEADAWADFFIRAILYGITLLLYLKYVSKPYRAIATLLLRGWEMIAMVPISFCIILFFLVMYPKMFFERERVNSVLILLTLMCAGFVYSVIYRTFKSMMQEEEEKNKRELLSIQNKLWQEQLQQQENALETARRFRHDSRHHALQTICMLRAGNVESAILYQSSLCERMEETKLLRLCENTSINGVLSVYAQRAAERGIDLSINVSIPNGLAISNVELCGLMANAMENAVEGCMRLPADSPQFIRLHAFVRDGQLRLRLINSCLSSLSFVDEIPESEKKNGGIGTKSIAYVAQQYHGLADFQAADGVFKLYVIINVDEYTEY